MATTLKSILGILRGPEGPKGDQGENGENGQDGSPGPPGQRGARGEPGASNTTGAPGQPGLIKLPVDVTLVSQLWEPNRMMAIRRAMDPVEIFWAQMNIAIQPCFSWLSASEDTLDLGGAGFSQMHYQRNRAPITLYIGSALATLPNTPAWVGNAALKSGAYGSAIIAGAHGGMSDTVNLVPEIFTHELGHILGLPHDNSTFMRESIRRGDNPVSNAQREDLRTAAYEWGGH